MNATRTDRTYSRILFVLALTSPLTWVGIGLALALLLSVACIAFALAYAACISLVALALADALASATTRRVWQQRATPASGPIPETITEGVVWIEQLSIAYPEAILVPVAVAVPEAILLPTEARRIALSMVPAPLASAAPFTTDSAAAWDRVFSTANESGTNEGIWAAIFNAPVSEPTLTVAACSPSESSPIAPKTRKPRARKPKTDTTPTLDLDSLSYQQLRAVCRDRDLATTGRRETLEDRLLLGC